MSKINEPLYRRAIAATIAYSRQGKKKPTRGGRVFHYMIVAGTGGGAINKISNFVGTRSAMFAELDRIMAEHPSVKTLSVSSDDGKSKFTIHLGKKPRKKR
jgi:hypothetical protein